MQTQGWTLMQDMEQERGQGLQGWVSCWQRPDGRRLLLPLLGMVAVLLLVLQPLPALAASLRVQDVRLDPCPADDIGAQPELRRPAGASSIVSCRALAFSNPVPHRLQLGTDRVV